MAWDRAYANLSFADAFGTSNISEEDEIGTASRTDLDLTFGYRFNGNWTGFLGYRDGRTEIDFQVRDTDIFQEEYYREDGFYIGASYAITFQQAGTLSFNAALIDFDSDLRFTAGVEDDEEEDDEEEDIEAVEFDDLEGRFSGSSSGFSVGVSWVMPIANQFAFRALYKLNDYDLEVASDDGLFEPDQQLRYLEVGLLYAF